MAFSTRTPKKCHRVVMVSPSPACQGLSWMSPRPKLCEFFGGKAAGCTCWHAASSSRLKIGRCAEQWIPWDMWLLCGAKVSGESDLHHSGTSWPFTGGIHSLSLFFISQIILDSFWHFFFRHPTFQWSLCWMMHLSQVFPPYNGWTYGNIGWNDFHSWPLPQPPRWVAWPAPWRVAQSWNWQALACVVCWEASDCEEHRQTIWYICDNSVGVPYLGQHCGSFASFAPPCAEMVRCQSRHDDPCGQKHWNYTPQKL